MADGKVNEPDLKALYLIVSMLGMSIFAVSVCWPPAIGEANLEKYYPPKGDQGEKPAIDIDDDRWWQIEQVYGAPLPQPVRAAIIQATEALLA